LPKALHLDAQQLEQTGEVMRVYTDQYNYGRRSPTGEYDQMVCNECEQRFQPWDEYGINFVRTHKSGTVGQPIGSPNPVGLIINDIDYARLKLFVLSMLWRADASSRPIFKRIDLGNGHRGQLRQAILNGDPGSSQFFAVAASLFKSDIHKTFLADPHPEQYAGVDHVRFYVYGGFTFLIKVDDRDSPDFLRQTVLTGGRPFPLILRDPSPSERQAFANVLAGK
jgi:hypothetical protein